MARIKYKEAAGLIVKRGKPIIGKKPERNDLIKLYINESKSIREIAELLNCSKDMIYRSLKEYEVERRAGSKGKRSKLRKFKKDDIVKKVDKKGLTNTAKEIGVDIRTLKKYLNNL
jgi:transposase